MKLQNKFKNTIASQIVRTARLDGTEMCNHAGHKQHYIGNQLPG